MAPGLPEADDSIGEVFAKEDGTSTQWPQGSKIKYVFVSPPPSTCDPELVNPNRKRRPDGTPYYSNGTTEDCFAHYAAAAKYTGGGCGYLSGMKDCDKYGYLGVNKYNFETGMWSNDQGEKYKNGERIE
jgi:hypothetical protein